VPSLIFIFVFVARNKAISLHKIANYNEGNRKLRRDQGWVLEKCNNTMILIMNDKSTLARSKLNRLHTEVRLRSTWTNCRSYYSIVVLYSPKWMHGLKTLDNKTKNWLMCDSLKV